MPSFLHPPTHPSIGPSPDVIVAPSQPRGPLKVVYVDDRSVALTWHPPEDDGGAPVLCYIVEAKVIRVGLGSEGCVGESSERQYGYFDPQCAVHLMTNLVTGRIYQFRVYAENEEGVSDALVNKTPVRVKAKIGRPGPPGRPELIRSESETGAVGSVTVTWCAPINDGGSPVISYVIEQNDGLSNEWCYINPMVLTDTRHVVGNLLPGLDYRFRVRAENCVGLGKPSAVSEPMALVHHEAFLAPVFVENLRDQVVLEGQTITFELVALGSPVPEIIWYRDGRELWDGLRTSVTTEGGTSTLTFHHVTSSCGGVVECEAQNRAGMAVTAARLLVESPPKLTTPGHYEDGLIFERGEDATFHVTVTGKPTPALSWFHRDNPMDVQHPAGESCRGCSEEDGRSFLSVTGLTKRHAGDYSLGAVNRHGTDLVSFHVTVVDVPDAPSRPSVMETGSGSCVIEWTAPCNDGGSRITSYSVFRKDVATSSGWIQVESTRNAFAEVELPISGTFLLAVSAANVFGVGERSAPRRVDVDQQLRIDENRNNDERDEEENHSQTEEEEESTGTTPCSLLTHLQIASEHFLHSDRNE